jgi:hypothetical protein
MSEQIRREFTLPYSIEKIKTSIEDAARTSTGGYQIKDRNPAFNTYSISIVRMLNVLAATITLRKLSETETAFELSAIPGPQLSRMPNVTTSMIEDFLKKVGDFAAGKLVVKEALKLSPEQQKKNSRAATIGLLIGVIITALLAYFIFFRN